MRDVVFVLIFAGLVPLALARPYVAACLWAWISIMNPHTLTWGFARPLPWAMVAAGIAFAVLLFNGKRRYPLPHTAGTYLIIALILWMSVTSVFSINPPDWVLERWIFVTKIFVMLLVTLMLIRGRREIEALIWVITLSVAFYGVKGGLFTILTGGGARVWGPPGGMIADNNSIATAIVIVMPWMYYLLVTSTKKWIRYAMGASLFFSLFGVLGTQSRGALVSIVVMVIFLGFKANKALQMSLALGVLTTLAIIFMPDSWSERMSTITDYSADTSASSRIWTWQTLWNLALDRPLVGGGFRSDSLEVFSVYSPADLRGTFARPVYVAHSIYFQALGEHGFPGLFLFLALGIWTWRTGSKLSAMTTGHPEFGSWVPVLMRMCQVSLAGYASGGAFLSLMILDLPYYIVAVVIFVKVAVESKPSAAVQVGAPSLSLR